MESFWSRIYVVATGYRLSTKQLTNQPIESEPESELLYDWRFTTNQFVLVPSALSLTARDFVLQLNPCVLSPYVTSTLRRGRVSLVRICLAFRQVYVLHILYIACYWTFLLFQYIQVLCQYGLCKTDHTYLTYLMLQRQLSHLNRLKLDHHQL
jgi:hypothetical protein